MRLIDADKLCEFASNTKDKTVDANDIMRFPRVDAVQVVRCIDCRYASSWSDGDVKKVLLQSGDVFCGLHSYLHPECHKPDWFCADGKRRE